ncbi:hypothetical protein Tco_1467134 [Tanacetum coccineum]
MPAKKKDIMQINAQKQTTGPHESTLRDKLASVHFKISTLETTPEDIQIATNMDIIAINVSLLFSLLERISKKRTKNEAKTTKPDTEWKSRKKTKSSQTKSLKKSTESQPRQARSQKSRKTSLGTKLVKSLNLFKEEKEEKKEEG